MNSFKLTKEQQLQEANKLREIAKSKGYVSYINVSDNRFGCSTYVYITVGGSEYKVRFSDHSVSSLHRMANEFLTNSAEGVIEALESMYAKFMNKVNARLAEEKELDNIRQTLTIPEGCEFHTLYRTYNDLDWFLSKKPTAQMIIQVKLDRGAFCYMYVDKANGYGCDSLSNNYIKEYIRNGFTRI